MPLSSKADRFRRIRSRGFGLVEMLVAGAIGAMLMFGVARMIKMSGDGQHRADVKNDLFNLETRLRNLLSDPETCKAVLLDQMPNTVFDPGNLAEFNSNPAKSAGVLKLSDGTVLKTGVKTTTFRIAKLSLQILGAVPPEAGGRFEATLDIDPDTQSGGRALAGGEVRNRQLPLILTTTLDPTSKLRTITGCSLRGGNGKEMCELIGGRWLESLNRCFFGGDLKLNRFECLDPKEFQPGGPLEGALVHECYYRNAYNSRRLSTYTCYNFPNPQYPRCVCQSGETAGQSGWQLRRPKNNAFIRGCDSGVLIKVPDERTVFLQDNEIVEGTRIGIETDEAPPPVTLAQWQLNDDISDSVMNCYYENLVNSMRAFQCQQGDKARLGQAGSCVFVNGSRANDGTKLIENYTGWIRVSTPRSLVLQGAKGSYYYSVQEATGRRCDFVQAIAGAEGTLSDPFTDTTDPTGATEPGTTVLTDPVRFRDLQECIFLGGNGDHVPTPKSAKPYRGAYVNRYPCHNEDIDPSNLTGDAAGVSNPTLNRGSCWYFKDVTLPAALAQNWVPGRTGTKYTGWAYLRSDLPDEKFNTDATTLVVKPQVAWTLNAIPCNLGVRLPRSN